MINPGDKFGFWTTIEKVAPIKTRKGLWRCRCICGEIRITSSHYLKAFKSRSCGCQKNRMISEAHMKHGFSRSRFHATNSIPEYKVWNGIIKRCTNPKEVAYVNYGGRGITICEKWRNSFEAFYEDVGPRPTEKHSIDRINNDGNYEPSNVRWATKGQQVRNRRISIRMRHDKEVLLSDFCDTYNVDIKRFTNLYLGYDCDAFLILEFINNSEKYDRFPFWAKSAKGIILTRHARSRSH